MTVHHKTPESCLTQARKSTYQSQFTLVEVQSNAKLLLSSIPSSKSKYTLLLVLCSLNVAVHYAYIQSMHHTERLVAVNDGFINEIK